MKKTAILIASFLVLWSCKTEGGDKIYLKESAGTINSLSLVMDNDLWNGEVGDEIRRHFAAPVDGLPWEEPLFSIRQIPLEVFDGFARTSRSILLIDSDSTTFEIKDNVYAKPQKITYIKSRDGRELIRLIRENAPEIIAAYKEQEIKERQRQMNLDPAREPALKEKLGISLTMPSIYKVVKQENNFLWIERQLIIGKGGNKGRGTTNIIAYELPLNAIPKDSTRVEAIIKMRDSIGKKYIPGKREGMYMITEKAYAPYVFDSELAGKEAVETRGMWEMKNFFMAGPFLNYIVKDEANNRLLVLEGFTFAPSTEKRDYMFELEAILKSLKIE